MSSNNGLRAEVVHVCDDRCLPSDDLFDIDDYADIIQAALQPDENED